MTIFLAWPAGFKIAPSKIKSYLLNSEHADGGPKCAFLQLFGFSPGHPEALAAALMAHAIRANLTGTREGREATKLIFEGLMASPRQPGPRVRTVWQLDDSDHKRIARFITLKPLPRDKGVILGQLTALRFVELP